MKIPTLYNLKVEILSGIFSNEIVILIGDRSFIVDREFVTFDEIPYVGFITIEQIEDIHYLPTNGYIKPIFKEEELMMH